MDRRPPRRGHWHYVQHLWTSCAFAAARPRKAGQEICLESAARKHIRIGIEMKCVGGALSPRPINATVMNQAQGYFPVFRNANFLKLWVAQILSLIGLQSLLLLSVILIADVTKSGIQTAGAIVAFSLPAVIFGPIAGVILD